MPPRFYASPFKNATATPAKREGWYSELPLATSLPNETSDGIHATAEYWLAHGASSGSLVVVPHSTPPGKFSSRAPTLQTPFRAISTFTPDAWSQLLYAGSSSGEICALDLPPAETFSAAHESGAAVAPVPLWTAKVGDKPVDILAAHPIAADLALAVSGPALSVLDASAGGAIVKKVVMPGLAWSAQWSADGREVTATGRDGKLRVWDVRQGDGAGVVAEVTAHAGLKPSRHAHLALSSSLSGSSAQLLTTGFSRTRDREFALFDLRNLGRGALKTQRIDTGMGVMQPLVDESRGIVYLAGRGDMTLRWVEVGGPSVFTEGAAPLPTALLSAALIPQRPELLDLQHAEINRLLVLSPAEGAVVPVEIRVPRRTYLDFYPELYPPVSVGDSAQSAADWRAGADDAFLEKRQLDPSQTWPKRKRAERTTIATPNAPAVEQPKQEVKEEPKAELPPAVPVVAEQPTAPQEDKPAAPAPAVAEPVGAPPPAALEKVKPEAAPAEPPTASFSALNVGSKQRPTFGGASKAAALSSPASTPTSAAPTPALAPSATPAPSSATAAPPAPSSAPTPAAATPPAPKPVTAPARTPSQAAPAPAQSAPSKPASTHGERFNPGWSRKFLTGKTPLKPDYYDLKDLSATTGNDVALLKANSLYFFYPLSGPGGRLALHPLSSKGRLATHPAALQTGHTITEFEVDPFDPTRVFVAGDDGAVRVFEGLPKEEERGEGWEDKVGAMQGKVLTASGMDKINSLTHHPAARSVLLSVSDDRGNPTARVWDVDEGKVLVEVALPKGGVSSVAWSPSGKLLAVSTKNKQVHVLDPRSSSTIISTSSHDSIRPVRLVWASETHLVSTGFNRAATRELKLYSLSDDGKTLSSTGKQSLDVTPAPLFPFMDVDTGILLLHARGERSCLAYEVDLAPGAKDAFSKLPSFEHGTLQSGWAFAPKTHVDVKGVEVVKGLRLSPTEVQSVSLAIPRAKVDRFQDDVYVPTRNVEKPSMSAADYLEGRDKPLELVDLRPEGMELLSQAPAPKQVVSTRSQIKAEGVEITGEEHLDKMFVTAQNEASDEESEDEHPVRSSHAPVDDDDW
ncbi:hypothetical protein JCM10207_003421 [Rhodosporidiobolus poonsookiae]